MVAAWDKGRLEAAFCIQKFVLPHLSADTFMGVCRRQKQAWACKGVGWVHVLSSGSASQRTSTSDSLDLNLLTEKIEL